MSGRLWESFIYDDVEGFQRLLVAASSAATGGGNQRGIGGGGGGGGGVDSSPGAGLLGSSPSSPLKINIRKLSASSPGHHSIADHRSGSYRSGSGLSRAELNARDQYGRTLLHHIASSRKPTAIDFALALLEIPLVDIYVQDWESGWTALHRALYAGNATIAQALMARDIRDATDFSKAGAPSHQVGSLIKIKDREGYSPFDVYGSTITSREIKQIVLSPATIDPTFLDSVDSETASNDPPALGGHNDEDNGYVLRGAIKPRINVLGSEVFTFGSNKNLNLGLGDQDDRQFPERVTLKRPEHLLRRFYREYQERESSRDGYPEVSSRSVADLPTLIRNKPISFQNIVMSKLHTAILTNDPESNLFMCGFGPGGRLGAGDESTRFSFVCIETGGLAGKRVISVALGQDHSLAITEHGEIFSWGSNKYGQLGYSLPRTNNKNDIPTQTTPRQIFNPFKKEAILGAAASAIHSVVYSSSGLYTFGKNEGQLGLVDSDARSLELQTTPRRVGASLFNCPIQMVSAIDRATAVLLQNHEVWVFSQFGYSKIAFPLDVSSSFIKNSFMATRYGAAVNCIVKITSGGSTICALSSFGEVFTVHANKSDNAAAAYTSTTNPHKARNSLSPPVRAWSVKKSHMAARDVDVGQDGSIIICTHSGSAWRKERRTKTKEGPSEEYKFARIPGLSRVVAVRSNAFGAYAVAQRDCDVTKEQIVVSPSTFLNDMLPLSPFKMGTVVDLQHALDSSSSDSAPGHEPLPAIKRSLLSASDLESLFLSTGFPTSDEMSNGVAWLKSTVSDARIPVHEFLLSARSPVLRKAFGVFRQDYYSSLPDVFAIEYDQHGHSQLLFPGVDFLTVLNLAFYLYTDSVLDVWHQVKYSSANASRYRQVRAEVMRLATHLGLSSLERAARLMIEPPPSLTIDMASAILDPSFFNNGDVIVDLNGGSVRVHSQIVCQRCPFFDALFHGRSGGRWLAHRRTHPTDIVRVDLKHIDTALFDFVLRYMYADTDDQLFNEVRSKNLDEFIDLVLDVMFVANELMIDRLAQICQKMLGRFVDARNVCHLLNSVLPCSTKDFKDAALEYICLNLGDLLANRYLEELDDDLLGELDTVCYENQMAYHPVSRGRNSDDYVLEKYPELVSLVERDRRRRIDSMKLKTRLNQFDAGDDNKVRPIAVSPSPAKTRTPTKETWNSPVLRSRQSMGEVLGPLDEEMALSGPAEASSIKGKMAIRGPKPKDSRPSPPESLTPAASSSFVEGGDSFSDGSHLDSFLLAGSPSELKASAMYEKKMKSPDPWSSSAMSVSKKDLKDIMAETSHSRQSNLTLGLSSSAPRDNTNSTAGFAPKLSQKERKKLQQQQVQEQLAAQQKAKASPSNPWQIPAPSPRLLPTPTPPPTQKPSMTLRQTVSGTPPPPPQQQQQQQSTSILKALQTPSRSVSATLTPASASPSNGTTSAQPAIQSIRHIPRAEPYRTSFSSPSSSSLSLATILMQQQMEKDEIREAATAKHNLQDIQMEQEFQEWWDQESKRVMEAAQAEAAGSSRGGKSIPHTMPIISRGNNNGTGRGKPSGPRRRGDRTASSNGAAPKSSSSSFDSVPKPHNPRREPDRTRTHTTETQGGRRGGRGGARGRPREVPQGS
ncbi:hypothetical protein ASPZODRAFT_26849 [Penicilliopsis zonata CBS 506.65]|uniref:BTB domain-containing protein n=1 Tax=Penicilliopsis zonata CBS 506.65 TaxID=1073090 RepID=A0A1L9SE46_9EURO|nr:hypothetical protein ASPZODRAFT_26849 [Penicilliopsis zonata CBS 506.65]OJJ45500.1 hypothetical protein ASPZODRAFT_26849 [Penicilliopsis zonata CBS 506.65]